MAQTLGNHDPNATLGPTACKLRLEEEGTNNPTPHSLEQPSSTSQDEGQVHATQALVSDLVHSLQHE